MALDSTVPRRLERTEPPSDELISDTVVGHLKFAGAHAGVLAPGAKILDFGCGIGASVRALLRLGYDAFGVDILASWNLDFDQYWHATEPPSAEIQARLTKIDARDYRLPFDDNTFDFCFSDQVFEHVFNYDAVFRELARVLKPGTISAHRFPGPNSPIEGHINVPVIPLCRFEWYLALWALAGRRSVRQRGFGWKETLQSNIEMMRQCNYPTEKMLRRVAESAGVHVEFMAGEGIRYTKVGRASKVVRYAERFGLDGLACRLMSKISQRYMVLYGS